MVTVAVPPDRLFRFVAEGYVEKCRRWDTGLLELVRTSDGPISRGTRGRLARMDLAGLRTESTCEVLECETDRRFVVRFGIAGQDTARTSFSFEPAGPRTRLAVAMEMNWAAGRFLMRSAMKATVRRGAAEFAGRIAALAEGPSANL